MDFEGIDQPFDSDYEDQFRFCRNIIGSFLFAQAGEPDLFTLRIAVFLHIGLCALEYHATLFFLGLFQKLN